MYVGAFPIFPVGFTKGYKKLKKAEGILLCTESGYDVIEYDDLCDVDSTFAVNFDIWRGVVGLTSVISHIRSNFRGFIYSDFIFKVADCGNTANVLIWSDGTAIYGNINKTYELHFFLRYEENLLLKPVAFIEESSNLNFKVLNSNGNCYGLTRCDMSRDAVIRMLM